MLLFSLYPSVGFHLIYCKVLEALYLSVCKLSHSNNVLEFEFKSSYCDLGSCIGYKSTSSKCTLFGFVISGNHWTFRDLSLQPFSLCPFAPSRKINKGLLVAMLDYRAQILSFHQLHVLGQCDSSAEKEAASILVIEPENSAPIIVWTIPQSSRPYNEVFIKVLVNPKFLPEENFFFQKNFFDGFGYRIYCSFALWT